MLLSNASNSHTFTVSRLLKLEEIKRSGTGGRQDPYMYKLASPFWNLPVIFPVRGRIIDEFKFVKGSYNNVVNKLGNMPLIVIMGQDLGWNNYNIIQDRATQMAKVMKLGVIISTVECNPCSNRNCLKLQTCSFGASKASRNERNFDGMLSSKSLDIHGAMTAISSISNGEGQIIKLFRKSSDYLGNGTFSSSNQFNGCIP
uniref:Uncharacterized protein n=1 Tax=Cucumis melo TaxID=3656 RepID=A0A9I9EGU9_CUCME